jgi:hypothetical protein
MFGQVIQLTGRTKGFLASDDRNIHNKSEASAFRHDFRWVTLTLLSRSSNSELEGNEISSYLTPLTISPEDGASVM